MYSEETNNRIFDNHALFNNYLSVGGMRQSQMGTKPSIYITELKLRNALKELSNIDIENIYDKEMTGYNCDRHRIKLKEKIELLHDWQLLKALSILMEEGRYESILYVKQCKRTDRELK